MSAKKNHYYVLVISEQGPIFVTKVHYSDKTAEWNWKDKPLEMSKAQAEDLVLGLNLNMHQAYLACVPYEIYNHPYNYYKWEISWKEREKFDED